jgi:hypothetical protein
MTDFDADGLLAALQEAMRGGEDGIGLTVDELCRKTGKGEKTVRKALRGLSEVGKLGVSRKRLSRICGGDGLVPSYFLK